MAGFLYFFKAGDEQIITESEIADRFSGKMLARQAGQFGDMGVGLLVTFDASVCRYEPENQEWEQYDDDGDIWVGMYTDERKPKPEELERDPQISGGYIVMGDNNKWHIPKVRAMFGGTALPQNIKLGRKGEIITEPLEKYAALSEQVDLMMDDVLNSRNREYVPRLTDQDKLRILYDVVSLNYNVGIIEINMLKLFNSLTVIQTIHMVVDYDSFLKLSEMMLNPEKKS